MIIKKIAFWVSVALIIMMAIWESTGMQMLPFVVVGVLLMADVYMDRDFTVAGSVLSILMMVINMVAEDPSFIDIFIWLGFLIVFLADQSRTSKAEQR